MNKLVKRGFNVWKIFLKNRVASSIMMLSGGVMMLIGALQGRGNDTISLPLVITLIGATLAFWSLYRLGYLKANYDNISSDNRGGKELGKKIVLLQIAESLLYVAVSGLGIFLLINTGFTNKVLNLMAGFFTTLNGVLGVISAVKNRDNKDFRWKLMIVVTICELGLGPYFIFGSDHISINGYIIMGALTSIAGVIEVITALTRENIRGTINDGKEIVRVIKGKEDTQPDIQVKTK